jgi:hypothetical protein
MAGKKKKSGASKKPRSSRGKSSKKSKKTESSKKTEEFICEFCDKVYKSRSGLSRHKKKCPKKDVELEAPAELPIEEELDTISQKLDGVPSEETAPVEIDIESQLEQFGGEGDELKGQLESELLRLQEEYKRQKEETEKLQLERAALQREREELDTIISDKLQVEKQKILEEYSNGKPEALPTEVSEEFPPGMDEEELIETDEPIDEASDLEQPDDEEPPSFEEGEDTAYEEPTTYEEPEGVGPGPPSVLPMEISTKLESIEMQYEGQSQSLSRISEELNELRSSVDVVSSTKLSTRFESIVQRFKRIEEEYRKQSDKIANIISEIGIGEIIDVGKVPPDILEGVYEATLNDIIDEMMGHVGSQGIDRIISEILESIRLQTSGSELFYFDGKRVRTRKLAGYIEKKLISAKQVQTTYETFVHRLIEHTHNYQPKNFKAMVSIKSQEYAVNNSQIFRNEIDSMKEELDGMKSDIYRLEDVLNEKMNAYSKELDERFGSVEEEVTSLKNSNIMFTEDIRKIIEKFEGEDISLESIIEMNKHLSERVIDLENAQNINVARFSAIERRILEEGETISDLVEDDVDVDDSIIKRPEEEVIPVEEVEEETEEVPEEEAPEEEKVEETEEPAEESEVSEETNTSDLEEETPQEVTEILEEAEEETKILEEAEEIPTELVEETVIEEAPLEIDLSKGTIELGADDEDFEEVEPEMDYGSIILGLVSEGYDSKTQIGKTLKKRDIKMSKKQIEDSLKELVDSDMVVAQKKGRYFKYMPKEEED